MADAQRLLSIQEGGAQRAWLQANAPMPIPSLVADLELAVLSHRNSNPNRSLEIAKTIEVIAEVWQDAFTSASASQALANAYRFLGEHAEAIAHFATASVKFRVLGELLRAVHVEISYIDSLIYIGQYETARLVASKARTILVETNNVVEQGRLHMNLGILSYRMGNMQEADAHFIKARPLLEKANQPELIAMLRGNHANIQIELDQYVEAQSNLKAARAVFALSNSTQAIARADANLGYLLFAQGEYEQALDLLDKARPVIETMGNPFELITTDLHRSEVYLALNLWQEALQTARPARIQLTEAERLPWEIGRLWLNEAVAKARQLDTYEDALLNARAVFAKEENRYWLAISDLYEATFAFHREDFETAKLKASTASTSFRLLAVSTRVAKCEILLGNIALEQNNLDRAVEHFNAAQQALGQAKLPVFTYAIYYGLGRCDMLNGEQQSALHLLRQAVNDLEKLQSSITAEDFKIGYLSDKMQLYETLVQLCLEINTPASLEEAFITVERAKSRALLDTMARNKVTDAVAVPAPSEEEDLLGKMRELQRDLSWHYNKLNNPLDGGERSSRYLVSLNMAVDEREQRLHKLIRRLRTSQATSENFSLITPITVKALQALLPNDLLLLEYYTVGEQILVFGVTNQDVWYIALPMNSGTVSSLLSQLRFQMNKFGYSEQYRQRHARSLQRSCDDVLNQLYCGLFQPIENLLSTDKVVIVPHGVLHCVPFHALFDGESYVIDKKIISYAPSSTLLSQTLNPSKRKESAYPRIVGLDDPTIPLAQDEAYAIAELFPNAELLVGADATLENVTRSQTPPSFMHLSTHALFRSDNASFSSLKLHDGWLSVNDIYSMRCVPRLVTLSACETGRHQVLRGDELIGLCRGFFAMGAKSLVVSLWKVEDLAASELMTKFYRDLQTGMSVNKALRIAQLQIKKRKPHPYYWAPFVLTGNMDTKINSN
ncbi:MAG: CHAT domain-containing protein [Candidatus Promineifilaceae bacterium]